MITAPPDAAPECYGVFRGIQSDAENDCDNCPHETNVYCRLAFQRKKEGTLTTGATIPEAADILKAAATHMEDRRRLYDKPEGERSMPPTVAAFNAITGHELTEEQGWLFMELLKAVRAEHNGYRPDNYEDGAAYCALKGEAAARNRGESST